MLAIELAKNASSLTRKLGRSGRRVGPKNSARTRDTVSREAYIIRRYLLWRLEENDIDFPISVHQSDAPDFLIKEGRSSFGLEFTEASDEKSGQLYNDIEWRFLSEVLGRPVSSHVVNCVIEHINSAIERKSKKSYAGKNVDLIIYPNSPARMAVGLFGNSDNGWNEAILKAKYDVSAFRNVYLFWYENDCRFEKL